MAGIYGAGAADEITEELVRRLADTDAGRTLLRTVIGAAGEGTEEVVSDLLSPLAEAMVRDESVSELYRQLDPADVLYDYLIGYAMGTFGSGVNIAAGRNAEANAELKARDAAEAAYLRRMEEIGYLPAEGSKNAAHEGAAVEKSLFQQVKDKLSHVVGKERAKVIRAMSFGEQVAGIESGLISKAEKPYATVRDTTPEILIQKAGAKQLPIIMSYDKTYLSARSEGTLQKHYHSLGAELMAQIPNALENPIVLIRQKNGRIGGLLDLVDKDGRKIYVVIELFEEKPSRINFNRNKPVYNLLVTAFGAKENYIRNQLDDNENKILKNELPG